jgi:hypothetical protein
MSCSIKDNTFYVVANGDNEALKAFDCLYINSLFYQKCKMQFLLKNGINNEYINISIGRPSDETVVETKIYF